MRKKLLTLMIAALCTVTLFSGCGLGSFVTNGKPKPPPSINEPDNPDNPDNPDKPEEPDNNHYTVSVYLNNKLFEPGDRDINVVWRNDSNVKRVPLGANGKADAGELDGDYGVYLEGLPSNYTYNPSAYKATDESRKVMILLTTIRKPESGDGKGLYLSEGCYVLKYDGTYRANISYDGEKVYYEYTPTMSGYYIVTSWVNAYEDEINPVLITYSGSHAYKYNPQTLDGGGFALSGGFTKNFRYECKVDKSEVGNSFTIAVTADCKNTDYPVYIDFAITYEGEYESDYSDVRVIRAKEAKIKAAEKQANETFVYADLGTKVFDMANYAYCEDTGFYHRYDEQLYADDPYEYGAGFGPILCCVIRKKMPCYSVTSLYEANEVGLPDVCFNYLQLAKCWVEEENKYATFDYTLFIRTDYNGKTNTDGVCYVTQELKEFLQMFASKHSLYTDSAGTAEGTPEDMGYFAKQDALWLFACGYYSENV